MASSKNHQMCKKIAHLTKCVYNLNRINEDNELDRVNTIARIRKEAEDRLSMLEQDVKEKEQKINEASEELKQLTRKRDEDKMAARQQVAEAREEHERGIGRLKAEHQAMLATAREEHRREICGLQATARQLEDETQQRSRELEAKERALKANSSEHQAKLDRLVATHADEVNDLHAKHRAELQSNVREMQEALAAANEKANKSLADLRCDLSNQYEASNSALREEMNIAVEEAKSLAAEQQKLLSDEVTRLSTALAKAQKANEAADSEIGRLSSDLDEARRDATEKLAAAESKEELLQDEIARNQQLIDDTQDRVTKLNAEVIIKEDEVTTIKSELCRSLATIDEVEKKHAKVVAELGIAKDTYQSQVASLAEEMGSLERALSDSSKVFLEKCVDLQSRIDNARREKELVASTVKETLVEVNAAFAHAINTAKKDGIRAAEQLREIQRLANDTVKAEADRREKAKHLDVKQIEALKKEVREKEKDIFDLTKLAEVDKRSLEECERERVDLETKCTALEQKLIGQCEQLNHLDEENSKLEANLRSRNDQVVELTRSSKELRVLLSDRRDEVKNDAKSEIEAALAEQEGQHQEHLAASLEDQERKHRQELATTVHQMRDKHDEELKSLNFRLYEEHKAQVQIHEQRLSECLAKLDENVIAAKDAATAHSCHLAQLEARHSDAIADLRSQLDRDHSRLVKEMKARYAKERENIESQFAREKEAAARGANESAEQRLHKTRMECDERIQAMRQNLSAKHEAEVMRDRMEQRALKAQLKTLDMELDSIKSRNSELVIDACKSSKEVARLEDELETTRKQGEGDRIQLETYYARFLEESQAKADTAKDLDVKQIEALKKEVREKEKDIFDLTKLATVDKKRLEECECERVGLESKCAALEKELADCTEEMMYFKRELVNREETYNRKFTAPNVGVMGVVDSNAGNTRSSRLGSKSRSKTGRRSAQRPQLKYT